MEHRRLRARIIATCLEMNAAGINHGTSGNVSARVDDGILITPSGMAYDQIKTDDIVRLHWDGSYEGRRLPSSEWRFHLDIMRRRDDCHAVVHTHAPACTTLACLHLGIPPFHYMIATAGGHDIRCADYARFGTQALSDHVLEALDGRMACLMANHGMLAIGDDLGRALSLAVEVEYLADLYWRCLQITRPAMLTGTADGRGAGAVQRLRQAAGRAGRERAACLRASGAQGVIRSRLPPISTLGCEAWR